jgi:sirohydrochlorin cobaltochelatase
MSDASKAPRTGLLLFAHGARDPRWAAPFEAVAQRVRERHPGTPVVLAYLELMEPDLPGAARALVAQGCTRIELLPMFLGAGGHVRKDIPALLATLRDEFPALHVQPNPAIGELDVVVDAMATAALALLDPDTR